LKRRVGNLFQSNSIYSIVVDDIRTSHRSEDGKRRISVFESQLSFDPLDKNTTGYQDPVPPTPSKHNRRRRQGGYQQRWNDNQGTDSNYTTPYKNSPNGKIAALHFINSTIDDYHPRNHPNDNYRDDNHRGGGYRGKHRSGGYRDNYSKNDYRNDYHREDDYH
jgi:hypothetical protein